MHRQNEIDIPLNDIYTQDYFLFCYSKLILVSKTQTNSKEGFTYLQSSTEDRTSSSLLMTFLDLKGIDYQKFKAKVHQKIIKHKNDDLDDIETDYIDIDELLKLYLDEFR